MKLCPVCRYNLSKENFPEDAYIPTCPECGSMLMGYGKEDKQKSEEENEEEITHE